MYSSVNTNNVEWKGYQLRFASFLESNEVVVWLPTPLLLLAFEQSRSIALQFNLLTPYT